MIIGIAIVLIVHTVKTMVSLIILKQSIFNFNRKMFLYYMCKFYTYNISTQLSIILFIIIIIKTD